MKQNGQEIIVKVFPSKTKVPVTQEKRLSFKNVEF